MIRKITKNEARIIAKHFEGCNKEEGCRGEGCRGKGCRDDHRMLKEADKVEKAMDALEVEALVDLAVKALKEFGIEEIEYEEGEEPDENEAICADEEGNEVGIEVKGDTLKIDLDEDEDLIVKLDQSVDDVKAEIKDDLEAKLAEQEEKEAEESNRRFEAWKRERQLRKEGKRVALNQR